MTAAPSAEHAVATHGLRKRHGHTMALVAASVALSVIVVERAEISG